MKQDRTPTKTLGWMAWACLLLLVLVTGLSAFLRHRAEGLGCQPWPVCYATSGASTGAPEVVARGAHRVAASTVLLLTIALLAVALRARPRRWREAALSALLLLLALLLAWLGIHTAGSIRPAVVLGNLLGGFLMVAIAARLVGPRSEAGQGGVIGGGPGRWRGGGLGAAAAAAALLLLQAAGGALVSASHAGLACDDLRGCAERAAAAGWPWAALKPWVGAGLLPGDAALLQLLHRAFAWVAALAVVALGVLALRRGRLAEGAALLVLLAVLLALGLVVGSTGLPLAAVLLHNLVSALLLALVVRLV